MERDIETLIGEFTNLRVWAVVGASTNPDKFGNKIYRKMRDAGYHTYGINPGGGEIDGQALIRDLASLPERPDVVDIVVPPPATESVVRQCANLGYTRVWMQPGSESEAALQFCREHGIEAVHDACAMIRSRTWD